MYAIARVHYFGPATFFALPVHVHVNDDGIYAPALGPFWPSYTKIVGMTALVNCTQPPPGMRKLLTSNEFYPKITTAKRQRQRIYPDDTPRVSLTTHLQNTEGMQSGLREEAFER